MAQYKHLLLSDKPRSHQYTSTDGGGSSVVYSYPARDRVPHAQKLTKEITDARDQAEQRVNAAVPGLEVKDIALEFFGADSCGLETDKLEDRVSSIELLSTREEAGRTYATVFIPEDKLSNFLRKIERYEKENDSRRNDGGPKNKTLVESIEGVRLPVVRSFWTDERGRYPADSDEQIWWEVWIRTGAKDADEVFSKFVDEAARSQLRVANQTVRFPERLVFLAYGSEAQWARSLALLGMIAELRRAKELPTDYVELPPRDQDKFVADGAARLAPPPLGAPAVCLLDTGVNAGHPLIKPVLAEDDLHAFHPDWNTADQDGHGTQMAGVAIFGGGLADHLASSEKFTPLHRLESVKLLHPAVAHDPENYGYVTVEAIAIAEQAKPQTARVACLAVTADDRDMGYPTLWSAAIDQHASGHDDDVRRLYVLSAGNIREHDPSHYTYPKSNRERCGVEDPGQSYNALTVGAHTELTHIRSDDYRNTSPIAPKGALSPMSRTSMTWAKEWPFKPDVVMEGGNYVRRSDGRVDACDDLRLLTTAMEPSGRLLDTFADTSAATAQASKLSAELMAAYPYFWPETIRGLLVHSAQWTPQMHKEFPGQQRETIHQRLRCYGYGVPDAGRAAWTAQNRVSLIAQESLRPYKKDGSDIKTNEYHFHTLPWPKDVLESLGEVPVRIDVTLSYFIEPSPGHRGWTSKFRYTSHGLRFALRGPTEGDEGFLKRISKASWSEDERKNKDEREGDRPPTGEPQEWAIGPKVRVRGSLHRDWWEGTAAQAAACGELAVYPVTGWWKERPHLNRYERDARYSLIVTITTPSETADLYTPIANQLGISIET